MASTSWECLAQGTGSRYDWCGSIHSRLSFKVCCSLDQKFDGPQGMLKSGNGRGNYSVMQIGPKTQKTPTH
jgi:hypothetical protein